jgi:hypothetical protein
VFRRVTGQGLDGMKGSGDGFLAGLRTAEVAIQVDEEIVRGGMAAWSVFSWGGFD